jgi:hypothetical protein
MSSLFAIQFRVALNFTDSRNGAPDPATVRDLTVVLADADGNTATQTVSGFYSAAAPAPTFTPLYYPPGDRDPPVGSTAPPVVPHSVLNMVRIPLSRFTTANANLNLHRFKSVTLRFDRTMPAATGAILLDDVAFSTARLASD